MPLSLLENPWIRIGDHRVPPQRINEASGIDTTPPLNDKRTSFYVHVDELSPVPVDFNKYATRLPTVASVARASRAKAGIRDVGDEVATMLRSCDTLDKTYAVAGEYLVVPVADLKTRYGHLNPGQQRMNLGNRMRAKWRKEHV